MELSQQAFGSPELMEQLARMDANLQALRPGEDWGGLGGFDGEQGLGLGDGTGALQDLADLDPLADQLVPVLRRRADGRRRPRRAGPPARRPGGRRRPDPAASSSGRCATRGYLQRGSDGELRLSPRAMRQLGKALLRDVATRMSGRQGQREPRHAGAAGDLSGATRAVGVRRHRAVGRHPHDHQRGRPHGRRRRRRRRRCGSRIDDVEVSETEARTQAAVALLVDTSFSMAMDGRWVPMKRTALALHQLISSRFRGDAPPADRASAGTRR